MKRNRKVYMFRRIESNRGKEKKKRKLPDRQVELSEYLPLAFSFPYPCSIS
jgi:hypothetical protein